MRFIGLAILAGTLSATALRAGSRVHEGDTGFFFRDAVECFAKDAAPSGQGAIYVGPAGRDDRPGDSPATARATLASALCNARPGQTIYVLPGEYHQSVIMSGFGTARDPIRVIGLTHDGHGAIFDGDGRLTFGLAIVESTNIAVETLTFRNFTDEGVFAALSRKIAIRNVTFANNGFASVEPDADGEGFGVQVTDVSDLVIENSLAYGNGPREAARRRGFLGTGFDLFGINGGVVRGNVSRDNIGGGVLIEDSVNVVVRDNDIFGNQLDAGGDYWDAGVWVDGGHDVTVSHNRIRDNAGPAVQISDEALVYPRGSCRYRVTDNLIERNFWPLYVHSYGRCPFPGEQVLKWRNNRISGNRYPGADPESLATTYPNGVLCQEWPCGKGIACDPDEPSRGPVICR